MRGKNSIIDNGKSPVIRTSDEEGRETYVIDKLRGILKDCPSLEEAKKERLKEKYGIQD